MLSVIDLKDAFHSLRLTGKSKKFCGGISFKLLSHALGPLESCGSLLSWLKILFTLPHRHRYIDSQWNTIDCWYLLNCSILMNDEQTNNKSSVIDITYYSLWHVIWHQIDQLTLHLSHSWNLPNEVLIPKPAHHLYYLLLCKACWLICLSYLSCLGVWFHIYYYLY